jgi:hypothetical protein
MQIIQRSLRTRLKDLSKELQRSSHDSAKSYEKLIDFRNKSGLNITSIGELHKLLKTNISGRILYRISNAAKKRGMIVEANEFIVLHSILTRKGIYKELPIHCPRFDYRDIPFKKVTSKIVIEKHIESTVTLFGFDGKPMTKELITRYPVFDRQEENIEESIS